MGTRFALTIAALVLLVATLVGAGVYAVWIDLDSARQEMLSQALGSQSLALAAVFAGLLALAVAVVVHRFFSAYVLPMKRLGEDLRVVAEANAAHRAQPEGSSEAKALAAAINVFAERHDRLQHEVQTRIEAANTQLAKEKNRLAALMSELTQSVIVCNNHGRILLYNQQARRMFQPGGDASATTLVGLGRSIYGIADRGIVIHALDSVRERIAQGQANPVSQFALTVPGGRLIRAQMAPVVHGEGGVNGFVLTMEDITETVAQGVRQDVTTLALMETTRAALGNIRAAIETLLDFPDMTPNQRERFTTIIRQEAESLSTRLDYTMMEFSQHLKTQWPLEQMSATDLVAAAQRQLQDRFQIASTLEAPDEPLWIKVESYSTVQALLWVAHRIHVELEVKMINFRLEAAGRFVRCDIGWKGRMVDADTSRAWENHPLLIYGEGSPLTLREVVERHGSELWFHADRTAGRGYLRLLLPATTAEAGEKEQPLPGGRPEYYDFDLFSQPGQTSELDETPLADLTYTVFDTETTGLDPALGDEIISLGAVRIVNKRLLRHECFDQLIDPRRPLPEISTQIHGISEDMLVGRPTIAEVLPAFARFAEDTVLIGHNAAFDMRFLQLKEELTGIRFIQPVLDTLLLSAVIHPNQEEHSLEAISARFGVAVSGRHTAVGDAIVTAEVFLKMLPLLAAKGIQTLGAARAAARQTYFARVRY